MNETPSSALTDADIETYGKHFAVDEKTKILSLSFPIPHSVTSINMYFCAKERSEQSIFQVFEPNVDRPRKPTSDELDTFLKVAKAKEPKHILTMQANALGITLLAELVADAEMNGNHASKIMQNHIAPWWKPEA